MVILVRRFVVLVERQVVWHLETVFFRLWRVLVLVAVERVVVPDFGILQYECLHVCWYTAVVPVAA